MHLEAIPWLFLSFLSKEDQSAYPLDLLYDPVERRLGCSDLEPHKVQWKTLPAEEIAGDLDRIDQSCSRGDQLVLHNLRVAAFNSGYILGDDHRSIAHRLHDLHISIAALLETGTRYPASGVRTGKYLRFSSSRDDEGHACEIFVL